MFFVFIMVMIILIGVVDFFAAMAFWTDEPEEAAAGAAKFILLASTGWTALYWIFG